MRYILNFNRINLIIFLFIFFAGCSRNIPTIEGRKNTLDKLVEKKETIQTNIKTSQFDLFSIQKISNDCKNSSINIYIEGDGLSWITTSIVSDDPTPLNPLALKLMLVDNSKCKIYIARPCQYIKSKNCEKKYWTSHRFNTKIIQSFNEALDNLKKKYKNSTFTLIGYSGGGAVAALVASKRDDINKLITVAGNLDINKWTKMHKINKLNGSLNPADFSKNLESIPQYHLIGKNDHIVPKDVFLSYKSNFKIKENIRYNLFDASHNCCWEDIYKDFLKETE